MKPLRALATHMRRLLLITGIVTLVSASAHASPQFRTDTTEFVFGQVPQNTTVSHTFWLYSTGDAPLHIDSIIPGCGCTTIPLPQRTIAPGDSVPLEITLNTTGLIGNIVKKPAFLTNATPDWQYFKIYGLAVTKPTDFDPLAVAPAVFDFTSYHGEPSHELGFLLQNRSEETVTIGVVDLPQGMFKAAFPDSLKPHESFQGRISLSPKRRAEEFRKSLTLEVNGSPLYRLTIPLYHDTLSSIAAPGDSLVGEKKAGG